MECMDRHMNTTTELLYYTYIFTILTTRAGGISFLSSAASEFICKHVYFEFHNFLLVSQSHWACLLSFFGLTLTRARDCLHFCIHALNFATPNLPRNYNYQCSFFSESLSSSSSSTIWLSEPAYSISGS